MNRGHDSSSHRLGRLLARAEGLFFSPIRSPEQWLLVVLVSLLFVFAPVIGDDWQLNTTGLEHGLDLYRLNPDYVYPPWALILLWAYRWIGAATTRVLVGLFAGLWVWWLGWSLNRFFAIVISSYFVFTLGFSNIDLFVTVLPILLWYAGSRPPWDMPARTMALLMLSLKPQTGLLLALVLMWHFRQQWRRFVLPIVFTTLIIGIPSVLGSPPLFLQWIDNLRDPSPINSVRWERNSVSLSAAVGFPAALAVTATLLAGFYFLFRRSKRRITRLHVYAVVLLISVLLSPYASHQSLVGFVVLVPSWPAVLIQYAAMAAFVLLGTYQSAAGLWTLLFGLLFLWYFQGPKVPRSRSAQALADEADSFRFPPVE
jgi:hypothetical protein